MVDNYPSVTVITPTIRPDMLGNCMKMVEWQDYRGKITHITSDNSKSIGTKRNELCELANTDIIIHFDDDDNYAPDWISKSVEHLIATNADIVGLSHAYFYKASQLLEYNYVGGQPYVIGASMCYWRKTWERKPFKEVNSGEDLYFQMGNKVFPNKHSTSFLATLHGNNTASHKNMALYKPSRKTIADLHPFIAKML